MATAAATIRDRVMAAGARIKRVKRVDRFATGFITLGGIFIVVSVSFIFLFIFGQALPLFRAADGRVLGTLTLTAPPAAVPAAPAAAAPAPSVPRAFGMDEYQMYVYELLGDGRLAFFKTTDGSFAREFPGLCVREPAIVGRQRLDSGKEFLRLKFRIWPNRASPIETTFKQELEAELVRENADYKQWMISVTNEIEARTTARLGFSWLLGRVDTPRDDGTAEHRQAGNA